MTDSGTLTPLLTRLLTESPIDGFVLDKDIFSRLETHWREVKETNEKFNLTAIVNDEDAAVKHYWDSLFLSSYINNMNISNTHKEKIRCVDVGSGAGFPGLVLATACSDSEWTLIDSLRKRCDFLEKVAEAMGTAVAVCHMRAEDGGRCGDLRSGFGVATARAVSALPVLLEYCLPYLRVGGIFLAMKGPAAKDELASSSRALKELKGRLRENLEYALPVSGERRTLLVIEKTGETPAKYPRHAAIMKKEPL